MKKYRSGYIFLIGILIILFGLLQFTQKNGFTVSSVFEEKSHPITLMFVGDIMLSRNIGSLIDIHGPNFPFLFIASTTNTADITFGNLENPVSLRGVNVGSIYSFRANPISLQGLSSAGFDVVSLANNHITDWGDEAFLDSIEHTRSTGISSVGIGKTLDEAREAVVINRGAHSVCFHAYSQFYGRYGRFDSSPSIAPIQKEMIEQDVLESRDVCDIVVVSLHWGDEYVTKANSYQREIGRAIIDAGANFVIGHHPHVLQEVEEYNGGIIAYSLGNFVFDQNFSFDTRRSAILSAQFENGAISSYEMIPIQFTSQYQPYAVY